MDESRARFDEAAAMITEALETGYVEGDGPFYPRPRTRLRPGPRASFRGRLYCVAGSPDSVASCVGLGASLMSIVTRPVRDTMPVFDAYREQWRAHHGGTPPPISLNVNLYCHEDAQVAGERSRQYIATFFASNVRHYEMAGDHFARTAGYERYADVARGLRAVGLEKAAAAYAECALAGTPAQILEQLADVRSVLGDFELIVLPSFGGMPYDQAERSLELFASDVMPAARELAG
jgi:alkanesulfonate monooxygenase SsuD/methylene tetrahydromethanopterin reductase-like flavin-dependent oxidoreductase (luciferase family)